MARRQSVMKHQFSRVPKAQIQRSSFDRSHGHKTTFDAGFLVPVYVDEALPGDTFNMRMTAFARMATPIKPVMDNLFMESFFFAVPYRLVWDDWEKFNGAQQNPGDSTEFVVPNQTVNGSRLLNDYMGLPNANFPITYNCLHQRAYALIWNEWFRDQNLQPSAALSTASGTDTNAYNMQRRGKRHDYFTSCLPWPQKGEDITIPIGGTAAVEGIGVQGIANTSINVRGVDTNGTVNDWPVGFESGVQEGQDTLPTYGAQTGAKDFGSLAAIEGQDVGGGNIYPRIVTDLSATTAVTINQLREAFQMQKMLEKDARGGTRYTEIIKSHFGVTSPDARLQRPEFLGGGSSPIQMKVVEQTQATSSDVQQNDTPQGNLSAYATATLNNHGFTKSFTEHCLLIGMVNVRADLTYQNGMNRMWSRETRYDFFWPSLAQIGEQPVYQQEIHHATSGNKDVFGYQERYAEYRYKPSQITGKFRSSDPTSLDIWHLSEEFSNAPVLGSQFIQDMPPVARVIATPEEPHFLFDAHFSLRCARPMPLFGVPGNIDRF